jgi:energy-coupling factor transporter transmembrane protein EcfT
MNIDNKLLISIICICIVLYIYISSCYINFLFNTILGRLILFLFIIYIINLNKIFGILLSIFILLIYNDYFYRNYDIDRIEGFKNDNDNDILKHLKLINKKINLDRYFIPKDSNKEIIFIKRNKEEPTIYETINDLLFSFY